MNPNELVEQNLGLARKAVGMFSRKSKIVARNYDDFYSIACLALVKAARRYDPSIAKFSTFGMRLALQAIQDRVNECKLGCRDIRRERQIDWAIDNFTQPHDKKSDGTGRLEEVLNSLPPRTREVVQKCHGIGTRKYTLQELASEMGLTKSRVHQIRDDGYARMRKYISMNDLIFQDNQIIKRGA